MNNELENLSPLMKQSLSETMDAMEPELTVEEIREMLDYTQKGAVKNKESRAYLEQVWAEAMVIFRSGNFKLAFSRELEEELDKPRLEFMAEDTEAGVIQAWLSEREDMKVCSLMIFKEALDNPYVKPKKSDTDRICEIMNSSIIG